MCLKAYRPPLPPPIISSSSKRHYSVLNLSQGLPSSDTTLKVHKLFSKQCLLRGWERTDTAKKTQKCDLLGKDEEWMDFRQQMLLRHLSASAYSLDSTPSWERSCLYCCHLHVKEGRRAVDISHPACTSWSGKG